MALALPRWIRAFDWPTLALIRERPNTRVSLRLRRNTSAENASNTRLHSLQLPGSNCAATRRHPALPFEEYDHPCTPLQQHASDHCSAARTSPRSRHQLRRAVAPTFPRALHPCTTLHQPASACIAPHEQALARRMGGGSPPHQCTHGPDAQPHRCPVHPPHSPPTFCRTPLSCRLSWELEQGLKLKKEQVFFLISMTNS
jgi:hypothetical protein